MTYVDTRLPSIKLTALSLVGGKRALALQMPADGQPRPVTAADFSAAPPPGNKQRASAVVKIPAQTAKVLGLNHQAKLEGRGNRLREAAVAPGKPVGVTDGVYDHPDVGGKVTICVLLWGPVAYYDLHRRCLMSIISTVPKERMELRVGSNELNPKSLAMVQDLVNSGVVAKHYQHAENALKYPVMREMFHDPDFPINTKWVVWFDDDSIADRNAQWMMLLAQAMAQHHHGENAHMFGTKLVWTLQAGQREWYESRPWYRQQPWRAGNGKPAPNGNKIIFATGGFWAITKEAIDACQIPDAGLAHNGGDYTIGEQLYQGGYNLKMFNTNKKIVNTSSVPRRGAGAVQPKHPGMK